MMKQIATCLMVALLTTGVLVSSSPVFISYASSNESGSEDTGEETSESDEPETEPEAEPEPEPEVTPTEPEPEPETPPLDNTCMGGPPGIDGCPPAEKESEPKTETEIEPCLLDPSLPSCPKPDPETQECPPGWAQNEDGNCFPRHPQGCPSGYHGHEDDETGRCIPNSTPCEPGYEFNEGKTNCDKVHDNPPPDNHNDHDKKIIIVKKIIKNIDIINKINNADSNGGDLDVSQTIVAINYNEGAGINCVFDEDDNGQCETFDVNKDSGKEPLLQIIDFD